MSINQAVVFTKPMHHLGIELSPAQLDERARAYLEGNGLKVVSSRKVTGGELASREAIKQHYLMYSEASCSDSIDELGVSDEGKAKFESAFGKGWEHETATGRLVPTQQLLKSKGIDVHQLFELWNEQFAARKTAKIQDGIIMAYLEGLDCYCINAFFPAMEANFNHPATSIDYYVVEFDPAQVSWERFRKNVLGSTDASKADPQSFRGRLYAEYPVEFPGRDNFVHGSAGPLEGLVERAIHEPGFELAANPVGQYLAGRGVTLEGFNAWKSAQTLSALGELFDATEEKDTTEALRLLDAVEFA